MRIGIGLPAAVPDTPPGVLGVWAADAERLGFSSLGVIDRLVYDNLEPIVALAAAAARTERVELHSTVINVVYRQNAVLLAKQLASLDLVSGGRLTVGLGMGGWPEDYAASGVPLRGRGATFEAMLQTMRQVWDGKVSGAAGPMPPLADGRPGVLLGGLTPASFTRAARLAQGWVAPLLGLEMFTGGVAGVRRAWADAGRDGQPRFLTGRYFCLGPDADRIADHYLEHYYGNAFLDQVRADTLTDPRHLRDELQRLAEAGCTDLLLYPCSGAPDQVTRLADTLDTIGARSGTVLELPLAAAA